MLKSKVFCLIFVAVLMMSACGRQANTPRERETASPLTETVQESSGLLTEPVPEKVWTEQEIASMFYRTNREGKLEYIDCVLVSDKASDRVGAVLFRDPDEETTNVAFYDEDGFANQCGVYAKPAHDSDFEYLGDGKVTFQLETEDGVVYRHALTISVDGSDVFFVSEDDLQDRKN